MRIASVLSVLLLAACIDVEETYTLNPDGSGKVSYTIVFKNQNPFEENKNPDKAIKKTVQEEIERAQGVDAWKDISYEKLDDGRFKIQATAYFKDIAQLKLHRTGFSSTKLSVTRDKDAMKIEFKPEEKGGGDKPKPMTDEEIAQKVKETKEQYEQMKPMMATMFAKLREKVTVRLPGAIGQASNFKAEGDRTATLTIEGKKLVAAFDSMLSDEAWLAEQFKSGRNIERDGPKLDDSINEKIFGQKGPVMVTTAGELKPQFDFAQEVRQAQEGFETMLKSLNLTAPPAPPASGGNFKSLAVMGVQHVYADDSMGGFRPFNGAQGMALSLVGEFNGAVLQVKGGKIEKAVADDGSSLLGENDWDREIHFPNLSEDKTKVMFEVRLARPGEAVKGLKEVSGSIEYVVGGKTKPVDIGVSEFKAGTKGKEFEAVVEKLEDSEWNEGHQELSLKLGIGSEQVQSVKFYDDQGIELKAQPGGSMTMNDEVTLSFLVKGKFPAQGKIVVTVFEDLKAYRVPFSLSNLDLLGKLRKE